VNPQRLAAGYMFGPSGRLIALLRPRLTSAVPSGLLADSIVLLGTVRQISPGKCSCLRSISAAFTPVPLDGYGLCFVT